MKTAVASIRIEDESTRNADVDSEFVAMTTVKTIVPRRRLDRTMNLVLLSLIDYAWSDLAETEGALNAARRKVGRRQLDL